MSQVTIEDIRAAAERIKGIAKRTPVLESGSVNRRTGRRLFFKCENRQRGGAFKIRGASNFIFSMTDEEKSRGVVAFSSGNHAQAVAIAAKAVGIKATLVMPNDAPKSKLEATRSHGAEIVIYDRLKEDREAIGRRISEETGAVLAPPFDHPRIIAGQGTAALELMEEVPDLDALVVCLGGGGLLAGCAVAAKAFNAGIRVFGVEPELANDYWLSLKAGERIGIAPPATIADGLRTTKPGVHNFPIIQSLVEDVLLVSEDEIKEAVWYLMSRTKMVVEPSGAVGAAAVLNGKLTGPAGRVGVVVSGGNVDAETLAEVLRGA
ncbi:MAG: pyridoxal-phosphate dependent enzyme [Bryobacteraceae bacterium]|nr:pyridoxal-phosphate dependent enzyme [Bryobacteraceae bacterium]